MANITRKNFEAILEDLATNQAEFLEEREYHRSRGHRSPTCFHGTNQWVDYDPMCYGCEEGHPNEYTSKEDARLFFQEWHGVDYDGDDLLGYFEPIAWGNDQVEVVRINGYENWIIKNEFNNICDPMVRCILALVSDGTEFEMVLGTDELRLTEEALV